jgi:hypothetical protein
VDVGKAGELDGIGADGRCGAVDEEGEFLARGQRMPWFGEGEADVVADDSSEGGKGNSCSLCKVGSGEWFVILVEEKVRMYLQSSSSRECGR